MGRRKKESDLFVGLAVLITLPFIGNASEIKSFLSSFVGIVTKVFIICAVAYGLYWFFSRNKQTKQHLETSGFTRQKASTSQKTDNVENPVEKELHKIHKESNAPLQSKQRMPEVWSQALINALEWRMFEELCSEYFKIKGYKANVTRLGADGGIDILLFKDSYSLTKAFGVIQCKAWSSQKVGVKPVRELYGVMTAERAPLGVFITSGTYTKEAKEFSKGKHLQLISGRALLKLILALSEEQQQSLLRKIITGDYSTPSCPSCGIKMTQRTSKKGKNIGNKFWGCVNFPKCRNTLHSKRDSQLEA